MKKPKYYVWIFEDGSSRDGVLATTARQARKVLKDAGMTECYPKPARKMSDAEINRCKIRDDAGSGRLMRLTTVIKEEIKDAPTIIFYEE